MRDYDQTSLYFKTVHLSACPLVERGQVVGELNWGIQSSTFCPSKELLLFCSRSQSFVDV